MGDALKSVAPELPPHRYPELGAHYRQHYLAREAEIPLFDGARELLAELDAAGYLLAVATGKTRAGLDRALDKNGSRACSTRRAAPTKAFPSRTRTCCCISCRGWPSDPHETLMIGDTTHDLELAQNAGAASLAVGIWRARGRGPGPAVAARYRAFGSGTARVAGATLERE